MTAINPVYRKMEMLMVEHHLADYVSFIDHTSLIMYCSIVVRIIYFCVMMLYARYIHKITHQIKKVFYMFNSDRLLIAETNCQRFLLELNLQFGIPISQLDLEEKLNLKQKERSKYKEKVKELDASTIHQNTGNVG